MRCPLRAGALFLLVALLPACHRTNHPSAGNPAPVTPSDSSTTQLPVPVAPNPSPAGYPGGGTRGYGFPTCLYCPAPPFPRGAAVAQLRGVVVLSCVVTAEGRATNIKVMRSLNKEADDSAVKTVSQWRFKPATGPDGKPAAVTTLIEVTFRLK